MFASLFQLHTLLRIALTLALVIPYRFASAAKPLPLAQLERRTWDTNTGSPLNPIHLIEDRRGLIWLTSPSGIFTFDGIQFRPFPIPQDVDAAASITYTLSTSQSGVIWGGSRIRGVLRIDPEHRVTAYGPVDGLPSHPVADVREDPQGNVWAVADGDLYHLVQQHWRNETKQRHLPAGELLSLFIDHSGLCWIAAKHSLFLLHDGQRNAQATTERWDAADAHVFEDPGAGLWVSLETQAARDWIQQVDLPAHPRWFNDKIPIHQSFNDASFDTAGTLWITGEGIDRVTFPPDRQRFEKTGSTYQLEHLGVSEGLSSDSTRYLLHDNQGDTWVTTMQGLERFRIPTLIRAPSLQLGSSSLPDLAPGIAGQVLLGLKKQPLFAVVGDSSVDTNTVTDVDYSLFQDREGGIWYYGSESLRHRIGDKVEDIAPPGGVRTNDLRQIVQLQDGSLLMSFYNHGVWQLSRNTWQRSPLGTSLREYPIVLSVDSRGALWAGYPSGTVTTGDGFHEQVITETTHTLGGITALYETSLGMIAAGQRGLAVALHRSLVRLPLRDPQLAEFVTGILQSANGDLWLNGRHGVARVGVASFQAALASAGSVPIDGRLFTESNLKGPAPIFYDLPSAAKDRTGRLWFNTGGAFVYVDPFTLSDHPTFPILSITSILADGTPLPANAPVPPRTGTVRIQYFGSNLTAPDEVRYRYRLSGVDDAWQDVDARTEAVYTHLRPGNYRFEVCAQNGDQVWGTPVGIGFEVKPTFLQTRFFLVLCGIAVAGSALAIYRLRLGFIVRRLQERAEARLEERVRVARELHDTLLQGFQGLVLRFHVAALSVPEHTATREQLSSAVDRAEQMMQEGRNRIARLREDDLGELRLEGALGALCEELAEVFPTACSVRSEGTLFNLRGPIKDELYWIAREALTNACHHAKANQVRVNLVYGRRELSLRCEDDGCGIDTDVDLMSGRPGHYGLAGMRERAQKIDAGLSITSKSGEGTQVQLLLRARLAYVQPSLFASDLWWSVLAKVGQFRA